MAVSKQRIDQLESALSDSKQTVGQLESELSVSKQKVQKVDHLESKLMVKEKELTKFKEDNKLLVKQFRDRKKKRRETISQVCYY